MKFVLNSINFPLNSVKQTNKTEYKFSKVRGNKTVFFSRS